MIKGQEGMEDGLMVIVTMATRSYHHHHHRCRHRYYHSASIGISINRVWELREA